MHMDERHLTKIDPSLGDALTDAPSGAILRAVLVLGADEHDERSGEPALPPSAFPSRAAWRQALLARRHQQLAHETGRTVEALRGLGLQPHGGTAGRTVVVEGSAQQLLTALDLPGVRHASLDRSIALAPPPR